MSNCLFTALRKVKKCFRQARPSYLQSSTFPKQLLYFAFKCVCYFASVYVTSEWRKRWNGSFAFFKMWDYSAVSTLFQGSRKVGLFLFPTLQNVLSTFLNA